MKVHYVNGIEKGVVNTATVSCFCNLCIEGVNHYGAEGRFMKNVINGNKNMNREHGVEEQNGETETTDIVRVEQPNRETETTDTISSDQEVCRRSRNK